MTTMPPPAEPEKDPRRVIYSTSRVTIYERPETTALLDMWARQIGTER